MRETLKKYSKKIMALCLTACLVATSMITLVACNNDPSTTVQEYQYEPPIYNKTGEKEKAIIILPGIFGSNLVDAKTEEPIWSGGSLLNNLFMTRNRLTMGEITGFFNKFMLKDEKGKASVQVKAATMDSPYLEYGIIDEYKELYRFFDQEYGSKSEGKEYRVVVYQYDWTQSAKESAAELQKFIDANNFEQNILVGHSLGGLVCDYYLTNNDNKAKTDGFISLGTPHYGAMDALILAFAKPNIDATSLELIKPIMGMLEQLSGSVGGINMDKLFPEEYEGREMEFVTDLVNSLLNTLRTMQSVYDLMPSKELFANNTIYIGNKVQTYDTFVNAAQLTESYINSKAVQNAFDKSVENRDSLYNGETFVIDSFIDSTYFIAGNGHKDDTTTTGLKFEIDEKNNLQLTFNKTNFKRTASYKPVDFATPEGVKFTNYIPQYVGDGMVLIQSATCGRENTDHATYLKGFINHTDLYSPKVKTESPLEGATPTEVLDTLKFAMTQIVDA